MVLENGRDDFFFSVVHDSYEVISRKITHITDVDTCDNDGVSYLLAATINDRLDVVNLLLEYGANPNCADNMGRTPLAMAVGTKKKNAPAIARSLIRHGADPDFKINGKKTARELMNMLHVNL